MGTPELMNSRVPPKPQWDMPAFTEGCESTSTYGIHDLTYKSLSFSFGEFLFFMLQTILQFNFFSPLYKLSMYQSYHSQTVPKLKYITGLPSFKDSSSHW